MRRVLLILSALLLCALLGAFYYVSDKGFTSKWRGYVTEEFRKRGLEVALRHLTLDPLRGLVARDVRIYEARDRRRTLAVIDEMALQVNFANLVRGRTFLDALELRDANLSLPLNPEKSRGPKIEIARLNARLFLPPQQIYLARADAEIAGLRITATGRLIHPQAFRLSAGSRGELSAETIGHILDEIGSLKFEAEPPVVNVTFSGDLAEPDQIFVEVAVWAERFRRQNYTLRNLYLAASYRGGVLDLKQLQATDASGELRLSGLWEPAAGQARFQLRSSLDTPALVRSCFEIPWLNDFVFYTPPKIDLRGDLSTGEKSSLRVLGHAASSKFAYRTVVFESAAADFSWDGSRWSVREARLTRSGGTEITADAIAVPGSFRAELRSTVNPKILRPLVSGRAAEILAHFEFPRSQEISLEARGPSSRPESFAASGEIALQSVTYRGVPADSPRAKWKYEDRVLSIAPFFLEPREGSSDGNLYLDFRHDAP